MLSKFVARDAWLAVLVAMQLALWSFLAGAVAGPLDNTCQLVKDQAVVDYLQSRHR